MKIKDNLTLAQLKKIKPYTGEFASSLIRRYNDIVYNKSIRDFTAEDLRLLIGQSESLEITIPLALEILKDDPLIEAGYYPGDLLENVLRANTDYWENHPEQKKVVIQIYSENEALIQDSDLSNGEKKRLVKAFEALLEG